MLVAKKIKSKFSSSFFKASVIVVLFVMSLVLLPTNNQAAHASLQDDLNSIQNQLQTTNQDIETKKNEATSLTNEIAVFDDQIRQTELKIQETETEMKLTSEKITQTETELQTQKEVLNEYLRVLYEESNTSALELIASSDSFSDFVDRSEYLQTMQLKIKDTVGKIKKMKEDLETKKKDLNKLNDQLASQKSDLNSKRATKSGMLSLTQEQQAELEKMAKGLAEKRGLLYCQIYGGCGGDIGGNLIVVNTSPHYYQQQYTSPRLDIPNYGCLTTSYAMVRTFFGTTTTPTQEAEYHTYSNSNMTSSGDFGGKPERVLGTNWNAINMALDNGKPVVVGLTMDAGYYTHFVVIFSHSGNTYYINDPAFGPGRTYNSSRVFQAISY